MNKPIYTCMETCGQLKQCGNTHCSANTKYIPPKKKAKKGIDNFLAGSLVDPNENKKGANV